MDLEQYDKVIALKSLENCPFALLLFLDQDPVPSLNLSRSTQSWYFQMFPEVQNCSSFEV